VKRDQEEAMFQEIPQGWELASFVLLTAAAEINLKQKRNRPCHYTSL
jgi:hypothetical protein